MLHLHSLLILALLTTMVATSQLTCAETAVLQSYRSLSLEFADRAAWAALMECRDRGYSVAVALVDRGGNLQFLLRDKLAGPHTVETAIRKAWTANSFRQSTADLAAMLEQGRIPNQVQNNPGALLVGGGLQLVTQGETVGAIGVSGAPPGKSERDSIDGACAKAGIDAIWEAMEMAD